MTAGSFWIHQHLCRGVFVDRAEALRFAMPVTSCLNRGGAFIAFHGSWNRAPFPQGGYNVVFQPLADGRASGRYVVFADGFAGAIKEPGRAAHRPSGLAVGPDGALYISDDQGGRIWRVTYHGPGTVAAAPAPLSRADNSSPGDAVPPEGIHPDAGAQACARPFRFLTSGPISLECCGVLQRWRVAAGRLPLGGET